MTDCNSLPTASAILDAQDALDRAISILNYIIDRTARDDRHAGESWILGDVEESLHSVKQLLDLTPPVDPETMEAAAQKERIDRAIAESMMIGTMKAAIAAHEARVGGAS